MMSNMASLLAALMLICMPSCLQAMAVEKGRVVDCTKWTRVRECSPWGLSQKPINPAFQYDYEDGAINHCQGVVNNFYYFKLLNFAGDLETSVLLRALKAVSEVMWNAWAHFHPTATDTLGMLARNHTRRLPANQSNIVNKNIAIAYAYTRITEHILPQAAKEAQDVLATLVIPVSGLTGAELTTDPSTPWGVGNLVAKELIAALKTDGWNSEGDMSPHAKYPFADYTNFRPVNDEYSVSNPIRWQPPVETDTHGYFMKQLHTTPQLRSSKVKFWGVDPKWVKTKRLSPPWNPTAQGAKFLEWYKGNVSGVINNSAKLNETKKLITEFFDNKIVSFGGFERWIAHKKNWCHDDFVMYDQLSSCIHDATIMAWAEKIRIDAIRPISAIRYLADIGQLPEKIKAWGGPKNGFKTVDISPYEFMSYMRTMPHSEFPSGTSCVCTVWAEWTQLFQKNDDKLDLDLTWEPGCSSVEQGVTPEKRLKHVFKTVSDAHKVCMKSREWAGVHFLNSNIAGRQLCSGVAQQCYNKVQRLLKGNPK